MNDRFPFCQLLHDDPALIHGDYKVDNVVTDHAGNLHAIDLDAAAIGPRLYDLAAWRLRSELGDNTPVEEVVDIGRSVADWDEDVYRSLIGWKAISSMSFTLRYETPDMYADKVPRIAHSAVLLGGLASGPAE